MLHKQHRPGEPWRIVFNDTADADPQTLRGQIMAPIKAAFSQAARWSETGEIVPPEQADALSVSFFPNQRADVLMMYDLADRRHFDQTGSDGTVLAAQFKHVFVPGQWLKDHLTGPNGLGLAPESVHVTGSPRIDYLRQLQAEQTRDPYARLKVLFAPLHRHWNWRDGRPMSVAEGMAAYLPQLAPYCDLTKAIDTPKKRDKIPVTQDLIDADIVITDYTSVIYEAWALGKPVIFPRWLTGDRVTEKARTCAEAQIYRDWIGHHPKSFAELLALIKRGRDLDLGPGVDAFMRAYIDNYPTGQSGRKTARLLERLADPSLAETEARLRATADQAMAEQDWNGAAQALYSLEALIGQDDAALHDRLAQALQKAGRRSEEIQSLQNALALRPGSGALHYRLGEAEMALGHMRAAAEAYSAAIALEPKKASSERYYKLGYALETKGSDGPPDPRGARAAYDEACARDTKRKAALFGVGVLHTAAGRWKEAQPAFRAQLKEKPHEAELYYRLGMAHDRCYEWTEAEEQYRNALALDPSRAAWHYRLGFVLERQQRHTEAAEAYLHATHLAKTHQPGWFYRAGYALEQAGDLAGACAAYVAVRADKTGQALTLPVLEESYPATILARRTDLLEQLLKTDKTNIPLWTQLSLAWEARGDLAQAIHAMDQAILHARDHVPALFTRHAKLESAARDAKMLRKRLSRNCTNPRQWQPYGTALEKANDLAGAIAALRQAVMRSDELRPDWHHQLGVLLWRSGDYAGACAAFRDMRILQRPHGIWEDRFETDAALNETATYREFHDCLPIRPKTVLYESFGGEGISDNPLAIFDHVLADPRFKGWTHIWVIDDIAKVPGPLRSRQDVMFVQKGSTLYKRWLATAEYLINNAAFPYYFVRRDGQKYLSTWHGTPLKTLGYDIAATPLQRANTARNLMQATMFIAPNTHTQEVMLGRYGVKHLFTGRSLITGYPRIDKLVNASIAQKADLREELGLDPAKPMVLYAPTYRGHWATPDLETDEIIATIEAMKSEDYNLVFRGHYFAEKTLLEMDLPVTIAPHAIDSCQLLAITDILITDYSSIFYDFLLTGRPVIHHVPDWDYYVETRGTYFDREALPGRITETHQDLRTALRACISDPQAQISDTYRQARETYCHMEDGQACARVTEAFFFADPPPTQPVLPQGAQQLLFHFGTLEEGPVTEEARALLGALKAAGHVCTVLADRRVLIDNEARTATAQALLDRADVLIRYGRTCMTPEEAWINAKMSAAGYQPTGEIAAIFAGALRHEVRRLLGNVTFDAAIEFEGARPFWANLLSAVPARQHVYCARSVLMDQSPPPERVIARLEHFDTVLSPSEVIRARNSATLGPVTGLGATAFRTALPVPDLDALQGQAAQDRRDDHSWQALKAHSGPKFFCPLPYTDPADIPLLLAGFAQARDMIKTAGLWVCSAEQHRHALNMAAAQAGLQAHIRVLSLPPGDLPAYMAQADCMVFMPSSDAGATARLLLASAALGRKAVVMQPAESGPVFEFGQSVAPTPQDLAQAMVRAATAPAAPPFAAQAHADQACAGFLAAIRAP